MNKTKSFEEMIEDLEQIAKVLESGDISLDESVEKFEQGMKISKECSKILEDAEKKISILINKSDNHITEENFEIEE